LINNPPPPPPPTTATLIVLTHVINDNGGTAVASNFTVTVPGATPGAASGAESPGVSYTVPVGSYSATESSLSGYTETLGAQCTGTVTPGEVATCTIINDDNPP